MKTSIRFYNDREVRVLQKTIRYQLDNFKTILRQFQDNFICNIMVFNRIQ